MKIKTKYLVYFSLGIFFYFAQSFLFNLLFDYKSNQEVASSKLTRHELCAELDKLIEREPPTNLSELNKALLDLTIKRLSFRKKQLLRDVNDVENNKAHCVGYSAVHSANLNYAFKALGWQQYTAQHQRGKVFFLGIDLCAYAPSSFFKDHDYVTVMDVPADKLYQTDAGLYEFLDVIWIE